LVKSVYQRFSLAVPEVVKTYFNNIPSTIGPFTVVLPKQGFITPVLLVLQNANGSAYMVEMFIYSSPQGAYSAYEGALELMPKGEQVSIGDGAIVYSQGKAYVAFMYFRNVEVRIMPPDYSSMVTPLPTPVPLSNDEWKSVLSEIYQKIILPNAPQ
jgi:hypothetical protein